MSAPKTTPEILALHISPRRGRRYVTTSAGGPGEPAQVVEADRGMVCLRRICIDAGKATKCPHAEAAREYLDEIDEATTAASLAQERAA